MMVTHVSTRKSAEAVEQIIRQVTAEVRSGRNTTVASYIARAFFRLAYNDFLSKSRGLSTPSGKGFPQRKREPRASIAPGAQGVVTGRLRAALRPGFVVGARYRPASPDQGVDLTAGVIALYLRVPYAGFLQHGTRKMEARQLFPPRIPKVWMRELTSAARDGVVQAIIQRLY